MTTRRQQRVAELLQRELALLIAYELKDPRLDFVSVTRVEVSQDLRHARVYVSQLGDAKEGRKAVAALEHASGFLRRALGDRTTLRYLPDLKFYQDRGLIASQEINALLEELAIPDSPGSSEADRSDDPDDPG